MITMIRIQNIFNKYHGGNREEMIDFVKGVLISLVVVGHILQKVISPHNFINNSFFNIIYTFHMPLFMFISGYLTKVISDENYLNLIIKKIIHLVVPFVFWFSIGYIFSDFRNDMRYIDALRRLFAKPDSGLWFLWILFLNNMFFMLNTKIQKFISKLSKVRFLQEFSFVIVLICILFLERYMDIGLRMCFMYYIYFYLGYLFKKYKLINKLITKKKLIFVVCLGYLLIAIFWRKNGIPIFDNILIAIVEDYTKLNPLRVVIYVNYFYNLIIPFLGIITVINLLKIVYENFKGRVLVSAISNLGLYTMEIYILHTYFINYYINENIILNSILSFIISILVPICISRIVSYSKILSALLFGKFKVVK